MIRFENVSKQYQDGTMAVHSLNFTIEKGEFLVLIGPSGCGKTTTLKMINRLVDLTKGTIFINEKRICDYDIHELRWDIGYVLQQIALFPHMTIEENIAVVPELKKWSRSKIHKRIGELLEMTGLDPDIYRKRKPNELSGGQQQRVGVIRALAADPEIILMDEPFSALDPISREKLQDDLVALKKRIQKTIIFVTHDMQEALKLGDRICVMKEGEIVQIGTPAEILQQPADSFVKEFIGIHRGSDFMDFKIEEVMKEPIFPQNSLDLNSRIPATASLQEILHHLSNAEHLSVEKDGKVIGVINRQEIIQFMAQNLAERGQIHE